MIHKLAFVSCAIPKSTDVWQFAVIIGNPEIGENCNINCNVLIEDKVKIGNGCTIKAGVCLYDGLTLGNNVFVASGTTFTNDKYPRSMEHLDEYPETIIGDNTSIGANCTILGGVKIGKNCLIGAGTIISKDIPDNTQVRSKVELILKER